MIPWIAVTAASFTAVNAVLPALSTFVPVGAVDSGVAVALLKIVVYTVLRLAVAVKTALYAGYTYNVSHVSSYV